MVHITDLVGAEGLGLVNCARCGSLVDASSAQVGTVVDEDVSRSALLCPDCGDDPDTQPWLTHHLTDGGDQPEGRSYGNEASAAQRLADQATDHLDAAKTRVEDAKKFSRSAEDRNRARRDGPGSKPPEKNDPV